MFCFVSYRGLAEGLFYIGNMLLPSNLGYAQHRMAAALSMGWRKQSRLEVAERLDSSTAYKSNRQCSEFAEGKFCTPSSEDGHGSHFIGNRVCFQQLICCTMTCGLEPRIEFSLLVIPLSA